MIASAYAYFNYRFAKYNFIDFDKWVFYEKKDIFKPKDDKYIVIIFSSHKDNIKKILEKISKKRKILAIDIYQNRFKNSPRVIYLTAGINRLIALIQRFNIYKVPSVFLIKRFKKDRYKQDSMVESL